MFGYAHTHTAIILPTKCSSKDSSSSTNKNIKKENHHLILIAVDLNDIVPQLHAEHLQFAFAHRDDLCQEVKASSLRAHLRMLAMPFSCFCSRTSQKSALLFPIQKGKENHRVNASNRKVNRKENRREDIKTLTCFKMLSREIREANLASSAAVEGLCTGEPPPSNVSKASSLLICCRI